MTIIKAPELDPRQDFLDGQDVSRVLELLKGKWTIHILYAMRERPKRLSELKREIPAASKKVLVAHLRILESERLVIRRDLSSTVLHVEYHLASDLHDPLIALLNSLLLWSKFYDSLGL